MANTLIPVDELENSFNDLLHNRMSQYFPSVKEGTKDYEEIVRLMVKYCFYGIFKGDKNG